MIETSYIAEAESGLSTSIYDMTTTHDIDESYYGRHYSFLTNYPATRQGANKKISKSFIVSYEEEGTKKLNTDNDISISDKALKTGIDTINEDLFFSLIKEHLSIEELESQIISKQKAFSVDHTINFIFKAFDEKLINNDYSFCNKFLGRIDVNQYNIYSLIALLTTTLPWKRRLPFRKTFYNEVKVFVYRQYPLEESNAILRGLE